MKVQLTLRENIPAEKKLIDHLEKLGFRSGEPKRLLMNGFYSEHEPAKAEAEPKKAPQVDNVSLDVLAG